MRLGELLNHGAEPLLTALEAAGEAYALATYERTQADWAHTRARAAAYKAYRAGGGMSVEDAKSAALGEVSVTKTFVELINAELKKDRAYLKLDEARRAIDLWRSEQANNRRV
jgi:hypothetical protein